MECGVTDAGIRWLAVVAGCKRV